MSAPTTVEDEEVKTNFWKPELPVQELLSLVEQGCLDCQAKSHIYNMRGLNVVGGGGVGLIFNFHLWAPHRTTLVLCRYTTFYILYPTGVTV